MSGIEIAGIVLVVLPLFIAAAERVMGGAVSRRAIKDGLFADNYKVKLTQQRTLLGLYIKSVVGRTNLTPSTQAMLVDEPTSDRWDQSDVTKAVSRELGDAYYPFRELLCRICAALIRQLEDTTNDKFSKDEIVRFRPHLASERTDRVM